MDLTYKTSTGGTPVKAAAFAVSDKNMHVTETIYSRICGLKQDSNHDAIPNGTVPNGNVTKPT